MLSKDLDQLNQDIDILYRRELGDSIRGIAGSLGLHHEHIRLSLSRSRQSKKIQEAVKLRIQYKERELDARNSSF